VVVKRSKSAGVEARGWAQGGRRSSKSGLGLGPLTGAFALVYALSCSVVLDSNTDVLRGDHAPRVNNK
jgi:hypothetical protein